MAQIEMAAATVTPPPSSLARLTDEIAAHHRAVEGALRDAVLHAIEAGVRLLAVKEQLGHGEWLPWVRDHFRASERTAQLYMRFARQREYAQGVADLGVAGAAAALAERSAPGSASRRPRAVKRAADLSDIAVAVEKDAVRGEGRTRETVEAFLAEQREGDGDRLLVLARVVVAIVLELPSPHEPLLCPSCDRVLPVRRVRATT